MPVKSLLLVDDDVDDQDIFLTALAEVAGSVSCITATNGEEALQKLYNGDTLPDVIFLDINMPILDGFDTLSRLKAHERLKNIPVFIYSTSVRPEDINRARELGAQNCIRKPSGFMEVCGFITQVLEAGTVF